MSRTVRPGPILLGACILVAAFVAIAAQQSPTQRRHTLSEGSSLVTMGPAADIWARIAFTREVWISPDGSGRIHEEHLSMTFPSDSERLEWIAAGEPSVVAIDEEFGPGKLTYLNLDEVPREPDALAAQLTADGASPAEVLRNVSLLLVETVPPLDLTTAIVSAVRQIPQVSVETRGTTVELTGSNGRPDDVLTTIVLDMRSGQLVSEKRIARGQLPSLEAEPPIVLLERMVKVSESLGSTGPRPIAAQAQEFTTGGTPSPERVATQASLRQAPRTSRRRTVKSGRSARSAPTAGTRIHGLT